MTLRYYLVPIVGDGLSKATARAPKYISDVAGLSWSGMDYGLMPVMLVAADVTPAQHTALVANADVTAVPANIDNTVGAGNLSAVTNALEGLNIPAQWVTAGTTWRTLLKVVAKVFMIAQRLHGMYGDKLMNSGYTLDSQWQDLPANVRTRLADVAGSLNLDTSGVQAATTLRVILRGLVVNWTPDIWLGGVKL